MADDNRPRFVLVIQARHVLVPDADEILLSHSHDLVEEIRSVLNTYSSVRPIQ